MVPDNSEINNKETANIDGSNKHLTLPMRLILLLFTALLLLLTASGTADAFILPLIILCAAFNTVLLIDCGKSAAMSAVLILFNLIPFALSFIISDSYAFNVLMLYPLLTSFPIWITMRRKAERSTSIAASAALGTVVILTFFALWIYSAYGKLNADVIKQTIELILAPVGEALEILSVQKIDGREIRIMTTSDIEKMMYLYKTVLIGMLVSANIVFSYIITLIARVILSAANAAGSLPQVTRLVIVSTHTPDGITGKAISEQVIWRIRPHPISAGVFILAYIVTILLSSSQNALPIWSTAANIQAILMPVFVYVGAREVLLTLRGRASIGRLGKLIPFFCILFIFLDPSSLTVILSLFGVILTYREGRMFKQNTMKGKDE